MTDSITLVNYAHTKCTPMKSITQLPEAEAFELAAQLYTESPCRAHRRFGPDFQYYYPHRLKTEKWLHEHFLALGGEPETEHPFYFALHNCESLDRNFEYGTQTQLTLSDIDPRHISFTFGDSIAVMDSPDRREPFTKDDLYTHIAAHGGVEPFLDSIKNKYDCIEAQLWTDIYFI